MISQQSQGNLFILSAPSGGGKSSLITAILDKHPDHSMQVSVSHTTRQPRPGEVNGEHYHFVSEDDFKTMIAEDDFFEWAEVFGNFYGTSRSAVNRLLAQGKDVFLDIDWQGARQVKRLVPEAISIFILPPSSEELERRLRHRGQDSDEIINDRMQQAVAEMSHHDEFDYLIVNEDFASALNEFETIVIAARLKQVNQAVRHAATLADLLA
jgi:guanylate kinase